MSWVKIVNKSLISDCLLAYEVSLQCAPNAQSVIVAHLISDCCTYSSNNLETRLNPTHQGRRQGEQGDKCPGARGNLGAGENWS